MENLPTSGAQRWKYIQHGRQDVGDSMPSKIRKSKRSKLRHDNGAHCLLETLAQNLNEIVIARASPEHKFKIVQVLQSIGFTVAVTGSKFADAQVLKRADVGIATYDSPLIVKECSDILIDGVAEEPQAPVDKQTEIDTKSVRSKSKKKPKEQPTVRKVKSGPAGLDAIVQAIEHSRCSYANLKKMIAYLLTGKVPQMLAYFFYIAMKIPEPMDLTIFLLLDWVIFFLPAICLMIERPEGEVMSEKPLDTVNQRLTGRSMFLVCFMKGIWQATCALCFYFVVMQEYKFLRLQLVG